MKKKLLTDCLRMAREGLHKHPEIDNGFMHWTFIVQGNKVIGFGHNHSGRPPITYGYATRFKTDKVEPKTHAESAAYKKCKGIMDVSQPWEIVNIRLNKSGQTKTAAPCCICNGWLTSATECVKCYFTIDGDKWGTTSLRE